MSTVIITGAGTGIGRLSAIALARAGHCVFATMRDPEGRNAQHAASLRAETEGLQLSVVELDVQSQESADAAIAQVLAQAGGFDVVMHNAAHLLVGYTEAFTAQDIAQMFDINAFGVQRVNRAALPHLRGRGRGTLLYVGSTTSVVVPPFLGPYVASKFAVDALAQMTAYEVSQFGIETVIVMPGAFTSGTDHFANAGHASDDAVTAAYAKLDPLVARNEQATADLFDPAVGGDPSAVADEIVRILALPLAGKPARSVVDFTQSHVERVLEAQRAEQEDFVTRLGFAQLLEVR